MIGGTIRGICEHGEKCIMSTCEPVVLIIQADTPQDVQALKDFLTLIGPLVRAPLVGVQATPAEAKDLIDALLNVINAFQYMKLQERMFKDEIMKPDPVVDYDQVIASSDIDPFTDFGFLDLDDGSWSDKS